MTGRRLRLTAGEAPAEALHWGVNVQRLANGWHVGASIEMVGVLRDADGAVEDYLGAGDVGVFDAGPFGSAEVARSWAESIVGGPVDWAGPGRGDQWRGFRDITTGAEIGDGVAINAGEGRREGVQDE